MHGPGPLERTARSGDVLVMNSPGGSLGSFDISVREGLMSAAII